MQIEPFDDDDGCRCWLSIREQEELVQFYREEPRKQLAIELMLDGLRSAEVPHVAREHFRALEVDEEAYKVRIYESKSGYRAAPVSNDTTSRARMLANARGIRKDAPLVDVSTRTIQRWVAGAAAALQEETGKEDWRFVSSHDLRRTWATHTYYSGAPIEVVMRWGGWNDRDTFVNNYLGREPDTVALDLMKQASLA